MDQLCLSTDHFKQFSVEFVSQNFPSFRIFVYRETTKFVVSLQALQFTYIFHKTMLNGTLFYCIWIAVWSQFTVLPYIPRVFHIDVVLLRYLAVLAKHSVLQHCILFGDWP